MGRSPRADEAGGIYHALNRGNARHDIFFKDADFEAFERIIVEGQEKFAVDLIAYQWMTNHWHMVLSPHVDGEMSAFVGWVTLTHTQRYHAHHPGRFEDCLNGLNELINRLPRKSLLRFATV